MEAQNARKILIQGGNKFRIVKRESKLSKRKDLKKCFKIPLNKQQLLKVNLPATKKSMTKRASFIVKNSSKKQSKNLAFRIQKALEKKIQTKAHPLQQIIIKDKPQSRLSIISLGNGGSTIFIQQIGDQTNQKQMKNVPKNTPILNTPEGTQPLFDLI